MFKKIVWLWFSSTWKNAKDVEKYITSLVEWWATEFFTWYNPPYWSDKFWFEVSPNGRFSEHEQITDFETLKKCVEEVHKHNLEIFINLNAWYYTDVTFPYIKQMVSEFLTIWVDWIICWNISILEYLKEIDYGWQGELSWKDKRIKPRLKINISTIFALYNTQSIRFFLDNYKINKVILSREVTLKEIEKLVTTFPETKFEVFWEWDFCRYNNWLCFAEHKYWSRDICTVVVNDLIIKKRFRPDFKKIVLDNSKTPLEKIAYFDDKYKDIFEEISEILDEIELWINDKNISLEKLFKIYKKTYSRVDLYFDWLNSPISDKNKKIIVYYKWLKFLLQNFNNPPLTPPLSGGRTEPLFSPMNMWGDQVGFSSEDKITLLSLLEELEKSIKTWMEYFSNKIKELSWEPKIIALEKALFYAKSDNLNLYSYLFFSKFKNIETVKFPTRWRNYNEKLNMISGVVNSKKIPENIFDRGISIERTHYDLTYLFWEKLWFRKMLEKNSI